ncbi:hypothetical protein [Williamsia sp.]|uniref:hypothetical protein n=1 Tax=Williamsia sp. TaxID=1872085 RepID=UPI002F931EE4
MNSIRRERHRRRRKLSTTAHQRGINLIDILVDADVTVTFVCPHSLRDFLTAVTACPTHFRMDSRV